MFALLVLNCMARIIGFHENTVSTLCEDVLVVKPSHTIVSAGLDFNVIQNSNLVRAMRLFTICMYSGYV